MNRWMSISAVWMISTLCMGTAYVASAATPSAFGQEMTAFNEKTKKEADARNERMKELRAKIEEVKSRLPAKAPKIETGTNKTIRLAAEKELLALQADMKKLIKEGLIANVEVAQKQIDFADQRLAQAKESLYQFEDKQPSA